MALDAYGRVIPGTENTATAAGGGGGDGAGDDPSVPTPQMKPAAPTAPSLNGVDPSQSPTYLAFLRGAGLSEAQMRASVARQRAGLQSQLEAQRPIWAQNLEQSLGRVLTNAAGRGTVRSGNRLKNQDLAQQDVQRQQAAFEGNIASQQAGLQDTLQEKLLDLGRQRSEAGLSATQDVFSDQVSEYQNNLTNYYLQQLINGA